MGNMNFIQKNNYSVLPGRDVFAMSIFIMIAEFASMYVLKMRSISYEIN